MFHVNTLAGNSPFKTESCEFPPAVLLRVLLVIAPESSSATRSQYMVIRVHNTRWFHANRTAHDPGPYSFRRYSEGSRRAVALRWSLYGKVNTAYIYRCTFMR